MTILIDPTSATPLYEQIVQQIQRQILSGTLPQGELLPGVRTLAADLSVSIITTRRAYEELERDGYIKTELHRQEMRGWLERAVSAAKAAGVSREEIIEQISRLYDQAGEEK